MSAALGENYCVQYSPAHFEGVELLQFTVNVILASCPALERNAHRYLLTICEFINSELLLFQRYDQCSMLCNNIYMLSYCIIEI